MTPTERKYRSMKKLAVTHMDKIKHTADFVVSYQESLSLNSVYRSIESVSQEIEALLHDIHCLGEF